MTGQAKLLQEPETKLSIFEKNNHDSRDAGRVRHARHVWPKRSRDGADFRIYRLGSIGHPSRLGGRALRPLLCLLDYRDPRIPADRLDLTTATAGRSETTRSVGSEEAAHGHNPARPRESND